jgi:hypothetical protein
MSKPPPGHSGREAWSRAREVQTIFSATRLQVAAVIVALSRTELLRIHWEDD